ncbi:MAG: nitrous oxide reductase family maturation protein NosD [Dechloromonas sp.]|jgi:nitrous oxidase accessory protein|nr:nitrous oxide reductase family maturation protein NosD [Dechloromonas sp.]
MAQSVTMRALFVALLSLFLAHGAGAAQPLQAWIDAAAPGSVLRLPAGLYSGPATIAKPLTLEGSGQVTIDGGGRGTVLTVKGEGVTLRGLTLRGSGGSHDALDGALMVEGRHHLIEDNRLEDVLFGISLHRADDNLVRRNRIRSRPVDSADRGDGIRLWYSTGNRIEANDIAQIRDLTVSNAPRNRFVGNTVRNSRRGLNLLFSHRTLVEGNVFEHNSTGIVALNSDGLLIRNNRVVHAMDASGAGVALKETAAALVQGNEIVHCAHGVMADSPSNPLNRIVLVDNFIAHNVTGIYIYGVKGGHIALGNTFRNNLWPVTVIGDGDPMNDVWYGNHWDDYQGFDRDGDGYGDAPHDLYAWADRIWLELPAAKFFRNAPVLELIDFLERLAPFSSPSLVLRDTLPRMAPGK